MFYKLVFDMERIDESIKEGTNTIYAEQDNLKEIEYPGIKTGFFRHILTTGKTIKDWPNVEFYYSSKASNLENEYLLNATSWPIIHKKVKKGFNKQGINGIQYLPIKLIDVVTDIVNEDYLVMNVLNIIEAIDLEKSEYSHNEKFDLYTFLPPTTYLDKQICQNHDIFRASKSKQGIYVSQKIKDIIEKNQWIGFEFYKQQTN